MARKHSTPQPTAPANAKVQTKVKAQSKTQSKAQPFNWSKALKQIEDQGKAHSYESELLAADLLGQLRTDINAVHRLIKSGTEHDKEIAKHLYQLSVRLKSMASKKYGEQKRLIQKQTNMAIKELAKKDFHYKPSRALEFVRLGKNGAVMKLKMRISHLVELSRLNEVDLKALLKVKPENELDKLSFREIQLLVKEFNSAKRKTKVKTKSAPITEFKKFMGNIEKVQDSFGDQALDDISVKKLEEFATWATKMVISYKNKKQAA